LLCWCLWWSAVAPVLHSWCCMWGRIISSLW
jgi:hypothetical protein